MTLLAIIVGATLVTVPVVAWLATRPPVHIVQGIAFPLPDDPRWERAEHYSHYRLGPVRVYSSIMYVNSEEITGPGVGRYIRAVNAVAGGADEQRKLARAAEAIQAHDRKMLEG